jgi:Zn-dependent peptidase ImmA (M78 family)
LVIVNSFDAPLVRQRFTSAHELGHLLLDADGDVLIVDEKLFDPTKTKEAREVRANAFAVHFLLPVTVIKQWAKGLDFDDGEKVVSLAIEYGLSVRSLLFHLKNVLGLSARDHIRLEAAAQHPYQIARRLGLSDRVRQEEAAYGAVGWPRRYVSLVVRALEQRRIRPSALEAWVDDPQLARELTPVASRIAGQDDIVGAQ